jgi:hypothetical protein
MRTAELRAALVAKGTVSVALSKPHTPADFYRDRAGLYVYSDFLRRVVAQAMPTQSASPATLRRFVLDRDVSDKDIEDGLGANHNFSESEVCWIVAEMIGKQEGGKAGDLDNTGKANLFYTPSFVVYVYWYRGDREWNVLTWGRDGFGRRSARRTWC